MQVLKQPLRTLLLAVTGGALALCTSAAPLDEEPIQRLTEWPKVESKAGTTKEITRLRKARTDEMGAEAAEALTQAGAAVVPLLINALEKEKDEAARKRVVGVLDAICAPEHTRLLAAEFSHDSSLVRQWAFGQVASTPDPGVREVAEAAYAKLMKLAEPDGEQRAERFAAARCVTSAGSLVALEELRQEAERDWPTHGAEIRACLEVVRGPDAAGKFWSELHEGDRKQRIATVRMLAGCGDKASARKLLPLLDDSDNTIRVAAINALRGIVDGAQPLDKLATFAAIEKALEWKQRL